MNKITILSRLGERDGVSDGQVAAFDSYDSTAKHDIRHYVLLDKSIKLMHEPWGWCNEWYADLMEIRWLEPKVLELKDLYLDIIIEGEGPTYRMIDFDDLAEALALGHIGGKDLKESLCNLQQFLDEHVHRAKQFPPKCIEPFISMSW